MFTMNSGKLTGVDLVSNTTIVYNIVSSNPNAGMCNSTKSNYNTYSNAIENFNVGDIYRAIRENPAFW